MNIFLKACFISLVIVFVSCGEEPSNADNLDSNEFNADVEKSASENELQPGGVMKKVTGYADRDEDGNLIVVSDNKNNEFGYQNELIDSTHFGLGSEEKERQIANLSDEAQAYVRSIELRRDSMASYLDFIIKELERDKVSIDKLTLLEKQFFAVKDRFEEEKSTKRNILKDEFKAIYSITAKEMNNKLKDGFLNHRRLLKEKNIPDYYERIKKTN